MSVILKGFGSESCVARMNSAILSYKGGTHMDRNLISQRQIDALKLEALRAYSGFGGGRPAAETWPTSWAFRCVPRASGLPTTALPSSWARSCRHGPASAAYASSPPIETPILFPVHQPVVILFLSSNPCTTTRLRLDEEVHVIDQALRQANYRDQFDLGQHWSVRSLCLAQVPQWVE